MSLLMNRYGPKSGDKDFGSVEPPHGYGAVRFDASGQETAKISSQRDGDWRVIGWVTSGGYGHYIEKSLAQAYYPRRTCSTWGERVV